MQSTLFGKYNKVLYLKVNINHTSEFASMISPVIIFTNDISHFSDPITLINTHKYLTHILTSCI